MVEVLILAVSVNARFEQSQVRFPLFREPGRESFRDRLQVVNPAMTDDWGKFEPHDCADSLHFSQFLFFG